MATISTSGDTNFRIGMLIYDTRYRSYTIQIIALIVFMLAAAWLLNNVIQNLADLGKTFGFSFLGETASYDINQRLIDYSSTSTHARAAVVGILNTLLVAILGCITATVVGVIAGVLRLSNNWLIARLMTIYVEGFRNIPVLIWILITVAVINETLPAPNQFRGADPDASPLLGGMLVLTNRGFYIPAPVMGDMSMAVVIVFLLSIGVMIGFRRWRRSARKRRARSCRCS